MKAFELLKLILDNPDADIIIEGQPLVTLTAPITYAEDSSHRLISRNDDRSKQIILHVAPRDPGVNRVDCRTAGDRDEKPGRDFFGYRLQSIREVLRKGGPYMPEPAKVAAILRYAYGFLTEPVDCIRTENTQGLEVITNGALLTIDADSNGVSANIAYKTFVNGQSITPNVVDVLAQGEQDRAFHAIVHAAKAARPDTDPRKVKASPLGESKEQTAADIHAQAQRGRTEVGQ